MVSEVVVKIDTICKLQKWKTHYNSITQEILTPVRISTIYNPQSCLQTVISYFQENLAERE